MVLLCVAPSEAWRLQLRADATCSSRPDGPRPIQGVLHPTLRSHHGCGRRQRLFTDRLSWLPAVAQRVPIAQVRCNALRKGRTIDSVFPVLIVIIVVCFVIGSLVVHGQRSKKLDEVYRRVARVYGGRCAAGGIFSRPSVRFTRLGVTVLLDVYSTGGKHPTYFTQLHLGWPELELRLEVFPESFMRSLGKLLGTQDIIVGSPEFDRDYIIRGNDEPRIAELLTESVQIRIDVLRSFLGNGDIYVGAKAGTLLIKKREFIREFGTLKNFITLGLDLYDEMTSVGAEGD